MADIVDTAVAAGTFKTLVAAVTAAKLVDTWSSERQYSGYVCSTVARKPQFDG